MLIWNVQFSHVDETELYTGNYVYVHQEKDKGNSSVAQEWKMPKKYSSDKKNNERRYLTIKIHWEFWKKKRLQASLKMIQVKAMRYTILYIVLVLITL